jgi:rhamnopyranosyl-N-acetylglucosaminyl-diphospho-decaprenol beta-1,3/1,4-galactofuranosyltransferase
MSKNPEGEILKVACVTVAYNNGDNIQKLLDSLLTQSKRVEEIIVIDNASSDDTAAAVKEKFPQVTLLVNTSNTGVGGGYAQGMDYAYQKGYEWMWLLDGDSLPQTSALEELAEAFASLRATHPKIGILASCPVKRLTNQRYGGFLWRGRFVVPPKALATSQEPFPVDSTISSGCLVSRRAVEDVGLPRADFFMDFVDHEYNLRVRRNGYDIMFVPASVVYHEIGQSLVVKSRIVRAIARLATKSPLGVEAPWRQYYVVRNQVYTFWHEFRNYRAVFFFMLLVGRMIMGMLLFNEKDKTKRIRYIISGLRDGFKGRLGRTVNPE